MKIRRIMNLLLAGVVFMFAAACSSYDNVNDDAWKDYNESAGQSSIIEHNALSELIANGNTRLVIIDIEPSTVNYIKGALPMPYATYFDNTRSDGISGFNNMVATGEMMDANISKAGITADSLIVITGEWSNVNTATRVWWVFKYWGFSNAQIKVLNGGNPMFRDYHPDQMVTSTEFPTPSTFSVKNIRVDRMDHYRVSFGEVFEDAKNGVYARGEKTLVSTLAPAEFDGIFYPTSGNTYAGLILGAKQVSNATFVEQPAGKSYNVFITDPAKLLTNLTDKNTGELILPEDKNARIATYCGSGYSTSVSNFLMQNVLGYTNVAIYDGSLSEWTAIAAYRAANRVEATPATPAVNIIMYGNSNSGANRSFVTWDGTKFLNKNGSAVDPSYYQTMNSNLKGVLKWDTAKYNTYLTFKLTLSGTADTFTFTPLTGINYDYTGDAREITREDRAYKNSSSNDSNGGESSGGGQSGGC